MEYTEAMSETPPRVTDELSARLLKKVGAPALVELTALVGFANSTTRSNTASPAIRIDAAGGLNAAVSVAVEDGRITRIYVIANPHKLARLDAFAALTRT